MAQYIVQQGGGRGQPDTISVSFPHSESMTELHKACENAKPKVLSFRTSQTTQHNHSKKPNFYFSNTLLCSKNRIFSFTSHIVNRAAHFSCQRNDSAAVWSRRYYASITIIWVWLWTPLRINLECWNYFSHIHDFGCFRDLRFVTCDNDNSVLSKEKKFQVIFKRLSRNDIAESVICSRLLGCLVGW